jgi:hypothetical protein
MGTKANELMRAIHGTDVYAGYGSLLPLDLQGWNSFHVKFSEIIQQKRPSVIIDVGVWKGASTFFLAKLLRENGIEGVVIAIDTFLGSPEHWNRQLGYHYTLWKHGRPLLYDQFLTNVVRTGFQDWIVPLPQTSENAAAILSRLGISASLIHIDAAHEYEAVKRDIRTYWDLLEPGGHLIGDDYTTDWPGVTRAADEFANSIGQPLTVVAAKWVLQKPQRDA